MLAARIVMAIAVLNFVALLSALGVNVLLVFLRWWE
jgi:hypothetical protein